ncbi:DNA translocase FtsK [Hartmannibacter diazotrophicus]|uniref:DNA translocase FtsK n=1 Tax=Hartmannibacter diazotrophicus TaxID=1482074 RepID=A0A2C9DB86_9HYPH|nr:DNA translocase FtsK [Hartmannibacter diazotrophicus]SON57557.1 DNA translocase FtsK [Hartmannibacter diazotrophicus]
MRLSRTLNSAKMSSDHRLRQVLRRNFAGAGGLVLIALSAALAAALATWSVDDPSWSHATAADLPVRNALGHGGAIIADFVMQFVGLTSAVFLIPVVTWGWSLLSGRRVSIARGRILAWAAGVCIAAACIGVLPVPQAWPLPMGLGGYLGDLVLEIPAVFSGGLISGTYRVIVGVVTAVLGLGLMAYASGFPAGADEEEDLAFDGPLEDDEPDEEPQRGGFLAGVTGLVSHSILSLRFSLGRRFGRREPNFAYPGEEIFDPTDFEPDPYVPEPPHRQARRRQIHVPPDYDARREPVMAEMARGRAVQVEAPERPIPVEGERRLGRLVRNLAASDEAMDGYGEAYHPAPVQRQGRMAPVPPPVEVAVPRAHWQDAAYEQDMMPEERAMGSVHMEPAARVMPRPDPTVVPPPRPLRGPAALRRPAPAPEPEHDYDGSDQPEQDFGHDAGGWEDADPVPVTPQKRGGWLRPRSADARVEPPMVSRPVARPQARPPAAPPPAFARDGRGQPHADTSGAEQGPPMAPRVTPAAPPPKPGRRLVNDAQPRLPGHEEGYVFPPLQLLAEPRADGQVKISSDALEQNARILEGVLDDFGVKGEIIHVRPGPVVTLYELEPAPGIKSSRVIGLADDIARSMSAIAARVAVIPGKNAIGIELPNQHREMVYLREILGSEEFERTKARLALALGKTIGGESVIVDLARTPHMLVAGTTGSGKSVAINTMIMSLLYRLTPEQCRLIMIDPKMLELSVYDGIPHLLTPVVTDPKKAVVALKWTVREMEDRYKKMAKIGVRNIDGFNARVSQAMEKGEQISRTVQTGFDRETGEPIFETEEFDLQPMPFIVVIIDEMADLMMVAGKEIEGAVQRLAQMARAAGIHVVMATQRPSVDVITGTIKANFPTRVSFQVTSKIDSRTILGEQGAEQLLGQGDMLYMAGGGRIQRVHGPFVSDVEVEEIVAHLKTQGVPDYLDAITEEDEEASPYDGGGAPGGDSGSGEGADLYDQAIAVVLRDKKVSTSYIQRRLGIGYNRAASIIERMEQEGIVSPANHAGKREILMEDRHGGGNDYDDDPF